MTDTNDKLLADVQGLLDTATADMVAQVKGLLVTNKTEVLAEAATIAKSAATEAPAPVQLETPPAAAGTPAADDAEESTLLSADELRLRADKLRRQSIQDGLDMDDPEALEAAAAALEADTVPLAKSKGPRTNQKITTETTPVLKSTSSDDDDADEETASVNRLSAYANRGRTPQKV